MYKVSLKKRFTNEREAIDNLLSFVNAGDETEFEIIEEGINND